MTDVLMFLLGIYLFLWIPATILSILDNIRPLPHWLFRLTALLGCLVFAPLLPVYFLYKAIAVWLSESPAKKVSHDEAE